MITLENHYGIHVLRDDLLLGGTKSIFLDRILIPTKSEYVYASPVFGGFQIALSLYCQKVGKQATIFCAKRGTKHPNTIKCIEAGAKIVEVPAGYLSVVEARAREYSNANQLLIQKIAFGANEPQATDAIALRLRQVVAKLGFEPARIYCAIGSGTLVTGILKGIAGDTKVIGVAVGKDYEHYRYDPALQIYKDPRKFETAINFKAPFPSMPNYDLKAWQYCVEHDAGEGKRILFWNVL